MSRTTKMVGTGIAPLCASQISGDVQAAVTAAGTTQANATPVYGDVVVVTNTAASTGVVLAGPAFGPGDSVTVYNQGANALLVYPPLGGTINALAANAGFSVGAGKSVQIQASSGTQFYTTLSA